ncbi:ABC transporter, substrate-binding protein (cluster 12, methionine/phosphonates) [hydrothermal vent metagenome]|uniref:ABC transporter, substrate-binding protein (Cluster 12, methionine/phosphonates) n=1 Tax=hydrothermal vent metagenome TaxID=652676 RepID=A0A3B0WIH2_9ZZZZ
MISTTIRITFLLTMSLLPLYLYASNANSSVTTQEPKTLIFSSIPDYNQAQLKQRFDKIARYLSSELAIPVKYAPVKSYASAVTAFKNNQIQLAWFSGLSGVRARSLVPGSEAIAQGIEDAEFKTYFIANRSTGIKLSTKFPSKIAGKNFTFASKGSTSGRIMPEFFIREHLKQSSDEVFNRVDFSGSQSRVISLVQLGAYQVGVVNFKVWQRDLAARRINLNKVSIIWKSPTYSNYQWSVRGDIDSVWGKGFKQKIKQALINMKDPKLLKAFPRSAFISASNNDYLPILNTAKEIGLIE